MEQKELDKRIYNMMQNIKEWITERGGSTGELHLIKTWRPDGQYQIVIKKVNPESTWIYSL